MDLTSRINSGWVPVFVKKLVLQHVPSDDSAKIVRCGGKLNPWASETRGRSLGGFSAAPAQISVDPAKEKEKETEMLWPSVGTSSWYAGGHWSCALSDKDTTPQKQDFVKNLLDRLLGIL